MTHPPHRTVLSAVGACRDLPAATLRDRIDAERAALRSPSDTAPSQLNPLALAVETLRTGVRQCTADIVAAADSVRVNDLQHELNLLLENLLLGMPAAIDAPTGFPLAVTASAGGAGSSTGLGWDWLWYRRSLYPLPSAGAALGSIRVRQHGTALAVYTSVGLHAGTPTSSETVDLSRIAARIDYGEAGYSILIDELDRRVELPWPAMKWQQKVRRSSMRPSHPSDASFFPTTPRTKQS